MESGKVVIASITSCTNTSNPYVMIGAGCGAQGAALGLNRKPWVKTSLAPGSQVVSPTSRPPGLQEDLDKRSASTSWATAAPPASATPGRCSRRSRSRSTRATWSPSVLSGNRNFEGRISPDVRANYLASPPLVVAYALAGTMDIDLPPTRSRRGRRTARMSTSRTSGRPEAEIAELVRSHRHPRGVPEKYADVFKGDEKWQGVETTCRADLRLARDLDLHPEPALFPGHGRGAGHDLEHRGRQGAGDPGRHDHHRPHLARRVVQGHHARRASTWWSVRCRCGSSTPTGRAAATTRS
jgi:aconitase A